MFELDIEKPDFLLVCKEVVKNKVWSLKKLLKKGMPIRQA